MPHILIVEDETIIRSALRRLLERNQYQVSEAGSVQEAQSLAGGLKAWREASLPVEKA